jgi:hypothetical protein
MSRRDDAEVPLDDRAVERRRSRGELTPLTQLGETPVRREIVTAIRRSMSMRERRARERRRTRTM